MSIKGIAKGVAAKNRLTERVKLKKEREAEVMYRASSFIHDLDNKIFGDGKRQSVENFLNQHAEEIDEENLSIYKIQHSLTSDMTDFLKFDYNGRSYWGDRVWMCGKKQHQLITEYLSELSRIFGKAVYFTFETRVKTKGNYYGEGRSSSSVYYYPTVYLNIPLK